MPEAARQRSAAATAGADASNGKPARALTPDMTVGEAVQSVLGSGLAALRTAAAKGDGTRTSSIHRFRVGLRRLRSLLSSFADALPEAERRALSGDLAAYANRYGAVREWDVLIIGTLRPLGKALSENALIEEIASDAAMARRRALPADSELGEDAAAVAARLEATPFLHRPGPEQEEIWRAPFKDFAVKLLEKRHRRLRKALKHVDLADQPGFHQVRIDTKKLRYPVEMFFDLFDEEGVTSYLGRVERVQNVLGDLNDALVAPKLLGELPMSAPGKGLVTGWLAREAIAARARFPDVARRFRHAEKFWEA